MISIAQKAFILQYCHSIHVETEQLKDRTDSIPIRKKFLGYWTDHVIFKLRDPSPQAFKKYIQDFNISKQYLNLYTAELYATFRRYGESAEDFAKDLNVALKLIYNDYNSSDLDFNETQPFKGSSELNKFSWLTLIIFITLNMDEFIMYLTNTDLLVRDYQELMKVYNQ
jgi:hypothetical protein